MKEYKKIMVITTIVTLLPILVGIMLWDQLPEQIATHFGIDGTPNGWTSKGGDGVWHSGVFGSNAVVWNGSNAPRPKETEYE